MKLTIDVPDMKCSKCFASAPVQPRLLQLASLPVSTKNVLAAIMKGTTIAKVTDSRGQAWEVSIEDKPAGWTKVGASDLCAACTAAWTATERAFLVPLPQKVVPEPVSAPVVRLASSGQRYTRRGAPIAAEAAPVPPALAPEAAPKPVARKSQLPIIARPTFGSSVPATHRVSPVRQTRAQPAPTPTQKITSTGGCTIPRTSFGSTAPLSPPIPNVVASKVRPAPKPTGPRSMYGGGVSMPKTDFGSTVPVPTAKSLAAAAKRVPRRAVSQQNT